MGCTFILRLIGDYGYDDGQQAQARWRGAITQRKGASSQAATRPGFGAERGSARNRAGAGIRERGA